jgi:hypothetical protein
MTIPEVAGWRSSAYGDQDPTAVTQGNYAYYVEAAKGMILKFPGSNPGCLYTVGYIGTTETEMPTQLRSTLGIMKGVSYASDNPDPEVMLTAFDNAGLSIILGLEPGNADTAVLATKILGKYKSHPCVRGMSMDVEWYMYAGSGPSGIVTLPLSVATAFKNAILAVNPNYKVMIKHFDASKLPKGISGVTYLTDTCGFKEYSEAISAYVDWANSFSGSEVAYQLGYDQLECSEDPSWWLDLAPKPGYGEAARQIYNSISSAITNPIYSVYWVDFTILTQFPIDYVAPPSTDAKFSVCQLGPDGVTVVRSVNGTQTATQASQSVANILNTL